MRAGPAALARRFMAVLLSLGAAVVSANSGGTHLTFVGCPILRNTELPCWLGEYNGDLYFLGPQGDLTAEFYPPEFGHQMLVEGEVAGGPRICGGVVLKAVKVSVLPDLDVACNVMLPADAFPDPPNNRGSGPSGVRGGVAPPPPPRPAPKEYKPPYTPRVFTANFNADSERLWRQAQIAIEDAARFAGAASASKIEITGYRAAIRLSNGRDYVERSIIAERRAKAVEEALHNVGIPQSARVVVAWRAAAIPYSDAVANPQGRSVSVRVVP